MGGPKTSAMPSQVTPGATLQLQEGKLKDPIVILLLDLYRYKISQLYRKTVEPNLLVEEEQEPYIEDAFDLLVADHQHKYKVALSQRWNYLVWEGDIGPGTLLRVTEIEQKVDQMTPGLRRYTLIHKFEVDSSRRLPLPDLNLFRFHDNVPGRQTLHIPLTNIRGFYVKLLSDIDVECDERWEARELHDFEPTIVQPSHPTLDEMVSNPVSRSDPTYPDDAVPLVGRVIAKSNLINYSNAAAQVKQKYPLQFEFEIQDSSRSLRCVAWNNCAMHFYNSIQVGYMVAIVRRYRLKKQPADLQGGLEVSINDGSSEVILLKPEDFKSWTRPDFLQRFPPRTFRYLWTSEVQGLPDGTEFDMVGRLQFVGPVLGEMTKRGRAAYRWLILRDKMGSILLKLYSCSQYATFEQLQVGRVLRCKVEVRSVTVDSTKESSYYYLSSCWTTQITVLSESQIAHVQDRLLDGVSFNFILTEPSGSLHAQVNLLALYPSLEDLMKHVPTLQLLSFDDVEAELDLLPIFESRTYLIQGYVHQIRYHQQTSFFATLTPSDDNATSIECQSNCLNFKLAETPEDEGIGFQDAVEVVVMSADKKWTLNCGIQLNLVHQIQSPSLNLNSLRIQLQQHPSSVLQHEIAHHVFSDSVQTRLANDLLPKSFLRKLTGLQHEPMAFLVELYRDRLHRPVWVTLVKAFTLSNASLDDL